MHIIKSAMPFNAPTVKKVATESLDGKAKTCLLWLGFAWGGGRVALGSGMIRIVIVIHHGGIAVVDVVQTLLQVSIPRERVGIEGGLTDCIGLD